MPRQGDEVLEYEDFLNLTVGSLKDFLALRGLKLSGKKVDLVARAFGAYELNVPIKCSQQEIYANLKLEYNSRLARHGIVTDPNLLPTNVWQDNISEWPEVDDGKLFSYILRVKAVDVDYIGVYKDQKAYSYWMSGFVDAVFVAKCPVNSKFTFLKSSVCPSQRIRDDPHEVWICTEGPKKDCKILTSWCTCTAGTGEACNHVIAVLYKVNYAFKKNYISPACTSVPQGWNKGTRRDVTPCKVNDLTFRKDKKTRKETDRNPALDQALRKTFDPRKVEDRLLTDERVSSLLNGIKVSVPSACVLYSVEHGTDDGLPQSLSTKALDFMSSCSVKNKPLEQVAPLFLEYCQLTNEQTMRIEKETRGQHSNSVWQEQRKGRVTASNFHQVFTKAETILKGRGKGSKKTQYTKLVSSIINKGDDISHLPQIKWGLQHEKDAIKSFMAEIASQHEGGLDGFKECGLFIRPDYPYLAASPDGIFICKCCGPSTLEAKCPYSVRNENIHLKEVYDRVDFLEEHNGCPRLKRTHKYYSQKQAQMWVRGVDHGWFIVWTQGNKPLIERITFDRDFVATRVNAITLFYKAYVLPCLLGYRDVFQCPKCSDVILEEAEINIPAKENSVCCDQCGSWWHLPCAGLDESCIDSQEQWFCSACLIDIADSGNKDSDIEHDTDDEANPSGLNSNHICSVCSINSIPVAGEHVCTICNKAVHAWCSNHEEITDSSQLVCNYCSSV